MDYEEIKVHKLEHTINGWGAKKTDEFLLKSDVDEWAGEQAIAYEDLEKRLGKTIAEKGRKNEELFAENASLRKRNKELEAENASLRNSKETYSEMLLESIKQLAKEGK